MSAGGRLSVVLYTTRHVPPGEELTFNYACVTEVRRRPPRRSPGVIAPGVCLPG